MLRKQNEKLLRLISRQTERLLKKIKKDHEKKEVTNADIELLGVHYCNIVRTKSHDAERAMEAFHDCLAKLDEPREVRILTERFVNALTMEEIAKKEGISRKTVYEIYNASLKKIKNRLT